MTEEEILADAQAALMTEDDILADAQQALAPAVDPGAEAARKYAEQAGTGRALGAGLAEGATFGFSDEIQAAIDQLTGAASEPGYLTPQQRTAILKEKAPGAYMGGDIAASLATGLIPVAGPALRGAGLAKGAARVGTQAALGALEGAGRAEPGERLEGAGMGALFGAAGEAAGQGLSAAVKGRQAARTAKAAEKAMKNPEYAAALNKASKVETMLTSEQNKLETLMGKLESEKISVRQQAEKGLQGLLDDSRKAAKELEGIRVKLDQTKPASRTSPEFIEYQQAKAEVDRLQKLVDANTRKLQEVEATAPTKLGAERERAIASAERGVQKAEQRVLSAQEEQEVNDILKKVFEGEKAAKKAARKAAKQAQAPAQAAAPEAPVIATVQDLTRVERELIEDFFASSPESSKRAAAAALGMDKSTFNRRMADFGLTPESAAEASRARAAQKADIARAAEELVPGPKPPVPPAQEPMPRGSMFSRADVRKMRQQGEILPTRQAFAEEGAVRAREAVKAAEAPIVPTFQSRFAPEIDIRQEQVSQLSNQLDEAIAIREEALRALQQAQSPQARAALQQNLARAEQVASETGQAYDDALKAFEEQSFMRDLLLPPQVAAQQRNVQRVGQEAQKAQELAKQIFNKDISQLTAQETGLISQILEGAAKVAAPVVPVATRTAGARQQ